jgi:hypothetical protein
MGYASLPELNVMAMAAEFSAIPHPSTIAHLP